MSEFVKDIGEVIAGYPAVIRPWLRKAVSELWAMEEPPRDLAADDVEGVTIAVESIAIAAGLISEMLFDYLADLKGKGETVQ